MLKDIFGDEKPLFSGELLLNYDMNIKRFLSFKEGEKVKYKFFKEDNHFVLYIYHDGRDYFFSYYDTVKKFKEDKGFKILQV